MKAISLIFVLAVLWFVGCKNAEHEVYVNPNSTSGKSEYLVTPKEEVDSNLIHKIYKTQNLSKKSRVALKFVKWLLNEKKVNKAFKPKRVEEPNKPKSINTDYYLERIKASGFVTDRFIEIQTEKLEKWNKTYKEYYLNQDSLDEFIGLDDYLTENAEWDFDWLGEEWVGNNLQFCGVTDTTWLGGPDNSVLIELNLGTHKQALSKTKVLVVENKGKILVENIRFESLIKE